MKNSNYIDFKKQKKMANKLLRSPGTDNYERRDSPTLSPPPSAGVQAREARRRRKKKLNILQDKRDFIYVSSSHGCGLQ